MADVALTVYVPSRAATPTVNFTDNHTNATAGNSYIAPNDGRTVLILTCTDGGGATGTVDIPTTIDNLTVTDKALTLAANKCVVCGPFPTTIYGTTISISVSAATDVMAVSLA